MKKIVLLASLSLLLSQASPIIASAKQPTKSEDFIQLCERKKSLPRATRYTIDEILHQIGTKNCRKANAKIIKMGSLIIRGKAITDLSPIAMFPNLDSLSLSDNQITDLRPLADLPKLKFLSLKHNRIANLKPLAKSRRLVALYVNGNRITDIRPLANLSQLQFLGLQSNNISDLRPLANLKKLREVDVRSNKVTRKDCPFDKEMCDEVYILDENK
jgi:internalin A